MLQLRRFVRRARADGVRGLWARAVGRVNKFDFIQFGLRSLLLPRMIEHVHGPHQVNYGPNELIAISVMRDGMLWLRSFLAHHRAMGVKHFVILDNGSTDGSIEMLSGEPDVTLLATAAPYHAYENTMKRYLAERFCPGRWCLCVDVDELFDYPKSGRLPLGSLLEYLNERDFNAMITQMLDMFGDVPLRDLRSDPQDDLKQRYRFYDVSNIVKTPYAFAGDNERIRMHRGGIRYSVFGTMNGLTKVSLFKMDGRLKPFVYWHHALNARIADVSGVLLHFPFVSSFYSKVTEAVASGRYGYLTSDEYASYMTGLKSSPDLNLKLATAQQLEDVEQLVDDDFLIISPSFVNYVDGREPGRHSLDRTGTSQRPNDAEGG